MIRRSTCSHAPRRTPCPNLQFIVWREGRHWVASTIQRWTVAQGNTRAQCFRNLRHVVFASWGMRWCHRYGDAPADIQAKTGRQRLWTGRNHTEMPTWVRSKKRRVRA